MFFPEKRIINMVKDNGFKIDDGRFSNFKIFSTFEKKL